MTQTASELDPKLERIPGTGKRLYPFTAIDDCTRIRVLQTDNGAKFQSRLHWHAEPLDIRHVYIQPRSPHLNGKVERSHRIDEQAFYQMLDQDGVSDNIHLFNEKLREWKDYYNYHRPHGALQGQTPYERLIEKSRAVVSPGS